MSRIGRKPLEIPKGVTVSITKDGVQVKGPKGTLSLKKNPHVEVKQAKLTFEQLVKACFHLIRQCLLLRCTKRHQRHSN